MFFTANTLVDFTYPQGICELPFVLVWWFT